MKVMNELVQQSERSVIHCASSLQAEPVIALTKNR